LTIGFPELAQTLFLRNVPENSHRPARILGGSALEMLDKVAVLLAEDDENDVFLMRRAFERVGIPNPLAIVRNGRDAIGYLSGAGEYKDRSRHPLPGLLLLDLKMPWMDGFDVLKWLRQRHEFDTLPVVVLTSSKLQADIDKSREFGVYDYRVKPQGFEQLMRLLDDVRKCWLDERFNRFCCPRPAGAAASGTQAPLPSGSGGKA
jgi:CheY-like chemotaxis protein